MASFKIVAKAARAVASWVLLGVLVVLCTVGCGGSVSTDVDPSAVCEPQERGVAAVECEYGIVHPECGLVPGTTTCYRTGSDIGCCPPDLPKRATP